MFIRVRVLGTDYGSSWVRELIWDLLPVEELFAPAPAAPAAPADPHGNRAGVSRFYFGCFQNAAGSNSAVRAISELRIELPATLEHARGPEIG